MEPQNNKERKIVIRRFIAMFAAGVLLVTIPLYFTIRLPERENKQASEDLQNLQEQVNFQKDYFAVRVDSVKHLLDSYDSKNVDIDKLNADIGFILSEMENSIAADTSWVFAMNKTIIQTLLDLKKTRNSLLETSKELSQCRSSLNRSQRSRPSNTLD